MLLVLIEIVSMQKISFVCIVYIVQIEKLYLQYR